MTFPPEDGNYGLKTLVINHAGAMYGRDPGKVIEKKASAVKEFDPEKTWQKVEKSAERRVICEARCF